MSIIIILAEKKGCDVYMKVIGIILLIWNVAMLVLYGIDKAFAKKEKRRISEKMLLLLPLFMGGLGAMFGMVVFNHKTSKPRFRVWIPAEVVLHIALIALFNYLFL